MPSQIQSDFKAAHAPKPKRMAPLSVRLSKEQRVQLERDAVGMSLNAYVISKLFDNPTKPKRRCKEPTQKDKAIARALRQLSQAGLVGYLLSQIEAIEENHLSLPEDEEEQLRQAYTDCCSLRRDLIEALGLEAKHE
ncbi:MAG: hypothetical protein JJ964_06765 [Rhizobiales bacterium]|nr:hypothetical protein [Hyphomicrobiales bacterium]